MDNTKTGLVTEAFNKLKNHGIVHSQKGFAEYIGVTPTQISKALAGDEKNLTKNLMAKVQLILEQLKDDLPAAETSTSVPLIPINALAGRLGDYSEGVMDVECERIVSPIKGATHAIRVHGDSMAPEYPNGSMILIKQINENIFVEWGKVYVLDTENGVVVKEVHKTDSKDTIECVSLNPDKKYAPFMLKTDYIYGWYRVLMVMSIK